MKLYRLLENQHFHYSGLIVVAIALALTGCASKPTVATPEDVTRAGLMDGAIAAAKAPLFKLTCPTTGCIISSLEVGNPSGAAQLADTIKVAMTPHTSEASENFRVAMGVVGQLGVWGIGANAVSNIFGSITNGFVNVAGKIQAPGSITTTTTSTVNNTSTSQTLSGTGVIGSGSYNAPITTTTNPLAKVCTPTYSATGVPTGICL